MTEDDIATRTPTSVKQGKQPARDDGEVPLLSSSPEEISPPSSPSPQEYDGNAKAGIGFDVLQTGSTTLGRNWWRPGDVELGEADSDDDPDMQAVIQLSRESYEEEEAARQGQPVGMGTSSVHRPAVASGSGAAFASSAAMVKLPASEYLSQNHELAALDEQSVDPDLNSLDPLEEEYRAVERLILQHAEEDKTPLFVGTRPLTDEETQSGLRPSPRRTSSEKDADDGSEELQMAIEASLAKSFPSQDAAESGRQTVALHPPTSSGEADSATAQAPSLDFAWKGDSEQLSVLLQADPNFLYSATFDRCRHRFGKMSVTEADEFPELGIAWSQTGNTGPYALSERLALAEQASRFYHRVEDE